MKVFVNNISPDKIQSWNRFLKNHPQNTIFQSPEMYFFYRKVKNYKPDIFIVEDDMGNILGLLLALLIREGRGIKGYFSSRVIVYGGPLISEAGNRTEILEKLLDILVKTFRHRSVFIQFRNFFEWNNMEKALFKKFGFDFEDRLNLILATTCEEDIWSGMSESRRRQIRKGIKSGVRIETPANEDDVRELYHLLVQLYKRKVKKPLPGWSFFRAFYNLSKNNGPGIIKVVKVGRKVVGGIVSPVTPGKNIYEWYVAGLDSEFKKSFPSVLATWASVRYALDHQLEYFDFLGIGVPDKAYGVREFKKKFGGRVVNYGRFSRKNNKNIYHIAGFGYRILYGNGHIMN